MDVLCSGTYRLYSSAKITRCICAVVRIHWERKQKTKKKRFTKLQSAATTFRWQKINHVLAERRFSFKYIIGDCYRCTPFLLVSFVSLRAHSHAKKIFVIFFSFSWTTVGRKYANYLFIIIFPSTPEKEKEKRNSSFLFCTSDCQGNEANRVHLTIVEQKVTRSQR